MLYVCVRHYPNHLEAAQNDDKHIQGLATPNPMIIHHSHFKRSNEGTPFSDKHK